MNEQQASQYVHDAITELAKGLREDMAAEVPPEVFVRSLMMGAASFTAAAWVASSKASGVDLALTKVTMMAALDNFYSQAVIPQTLRA